MSEVLVLDSNDVLIADDGKRPARADDPEWVRMLELVGPLDADRIRREDGIDIEAEIRGPRYTFDDICEARRRRNS